MTGWIILTLYIWGVIEAFRVFYIHNQKATRSYNKVEFVDALFLCLLSWIIVCISSYEGSKLESFISSLANKFEGRK